MPRRINARAEKLEKRRLLANLDIAGTSGPDSVEIFLSGANVRVQNKAAVGGSTIQVNGVNVAPGGVRDFVATGVDTITGGLSGGNDSLLCSANLNKPLNFSGGNGNDTIRGSNAVDTIAGGDNNDSIRGGGGNDILTGDSTGQIGADTIYGDLNNDLIFGGDGGDALYGDDNDTNLANDGSDQLNGGNGIDYLTGNGGSDTLNGDADNDFFTNIDATADTINGGTGTDRAGNDTLDSFNSVESTNSVISSQQLAGQYIVIAGESGSDTITVDGDGVDELRVTVNGATFVESLAAIIATVDEQVFGIEVRGNGGNDLIILTGNIPVLSTWQPAAAVGGDGNDSLFGIDGSDRLYGSAGDDLLVGGFGNDSLFGGGGRDVLNGDAGDDLLTGEGPTNGTANAVFPELVDILGDVLDGGSGFDTVNYDDRSHDDGPLTIDVIADIDGVADDGRTAPTAENDNIQLTVEGIIGGQARDSLTGSAADNFLDGGEEIDTLTGLDGNDTLQGGLAVDVYVGGNGRDALSFADKAQTVTATLDGIANDGVTGEIENVPADVEGLIGGAGGDSLTGNNGGNDSLRGGAGNDTLRGLAGNDELFGDDGVDSVIDGNGIDTVDGGAGLDNVTVATQRVQFSNSEDLQTLTITGGAGQTPTVVAALPPTLDAVLSVRSIAITGAAAIDVFGGTLLFDYATPTQAGVVRSLLTSGYRNGQWNGNGLNSTLAAATPLNDAVGYAEATDLFSVFPATFAGQQIDNTTVIIRYTFAGDANLDRAVDLSDFSRLATNFNRPGLWISGDFNYDNATNIGDFALMFANFNLRI